MSPNRWVHRFARQDVPEVLTREKIVRAAVTVGVRRGRRVAVPDILQEFAEFLRHVAAIVHLRAGPQPDLVPRTGQPVISDGKQMVAKR